MCAYKLVPCYRLNSTTGIPYSVIGCDQFINWPMRKFPKKTEKWKQTVDKHVSAYWVDKIKLEANEKSSLKVLNTQNYKIGEVHYLWKNAGINLMAIKKAGFKAKLMTGTYVLQSNRAKFNQYSVDPTCLLCGDDAEDMIHFLLKCECLSEPRDQFMEKISSILIEYQGTKEQK